MKLFGIFISIILIFTQLASVGQNNSSINPDFNKKVIQPYLKGQSVFKEQVYIHFNKSCYLPGDDIWFCAYIFDPMTGLLNPYSKNLYVELYNEKGKLLGQKILPVNLGTANNLFKLDEKADPGTYHFRAYTSWMKNFYTPEEYDRPLEIVGEVAGVKPSGKLEYDIQFFPESGTFLEGVFNKICIKALDPNGNPALLKGVVVNENMDSVAFINLNKMGTGEFIINPGKNSTFKAKVTLPDGSEQTIGLPKVESQGVIASVNGFVKDKILVEVKSNPETLVKEKTFYALIHSNGNIFQFITTKLFPGKNSSSFSLENKTIGNGVNCLTIFDEDFQPVAERLFYNFKFNIKGKLNIQPKTAGDSVELRISLANDSIKRLGSKLSISILPQGTVSNQFTNSLLAEVLIKSGVRGKIENPQYYLEKEDPEHLLAMDLLLLTQGWRKYDWKNTLKYPNKFENGFSISGVVKNWIKGKEDKNGSVSMVSPENRLFSVARTDSTGHYLFSGLYLLDSTKVIVSASNAKGKNWNRTITASLNPNYQIDTLLQVKPFVSLPNVTEKKVEPPLKLMPGVIQLPEFVISADEKKPFEHSVYVSAMDKSVEVTKEKYLRYGSLEVFLRTEFNIQIEVDNEGNYKVDMGRGQKNAKPKLIINDVEATDLSFLSMYTLDQIAAVSVNKDGNAITGDGGAIIIETRDEVMDWGSGSGASSNMKTLLIKGYSPPVKYYSPKYLQSPESETFQKYAAIFWKPDVEIDTTGVAVIKFSLPPTVNKINLRTEGISGDGTLYLEERNLTISNP